MEFKEDGTLLGRFWEGNLKLGRLLLIGGFKKKKRRRKEGGEFSFWERNLGLEGRYICEKRKRFGEGGTHWRRRREIL